LYNNVQQFVAEGSKDILCPKPTSFIEPKISAVQLVDPAETMETKRSSVGASPKCGFCGQTGHRNSKIRGKFTCPERKT